MGTVGMRTPPQGPRPLRGGDRTVAEATPVALAGNESNFNVRRGGCLVSVCLFCPRNYGILRNDSGGNRNGINLSALSASWILHWPSRTGPKRTRLVVRCHGALSGFLLLESMLTNVS